MRPKLSAPLTAHRLVDMNIIAWGESTPLELVVYFVLGCALLFFIIYFAVRLATRKKG